MDLLTKQFLKIVLILLHSVYEHISVLVLSLNPLWDFSFLCLIYRNVLGIVCCLCFLSNSTF